MTHAEKLFRKYEITIAAICSNYPNPFVLKGIHTLSCSTVRQQLRNAMIAHANGTWDSTADRDICKTILSLWTFGNDMDSIRVGPRQNSRLAKPFNEGTIVQQTEQTLIPPIPCSDNPTFLAVCHLKNLDLLPIPLTLTEVSDGQVSYATTIYPNVELIPITPGTFQIL